MDLKKVELYSAEINNLMNEIEALNNWLEIITNISGIRVSGKGSSGNQVAFEIKESRFLNLNSPSVKAFQALAFNEIDELSVKKTKELSELLKKGIEV
ncbi:hypothetical protein [Enterococcus caccae]|uniref:Uncharacterized protein n=1 Tax=Enterococcus caccae ATCC BAA-1240 TaxID=1158612 RepID=R3WVE4_9ENTE|nr:hypothetical protein [Enterococcus caccae]EOL45775.1 hypothetical protein UC7_01572 [Enterococcus caccae ATCC BAA-1240]EOT60971.1 hypothetical protein I580_01873 [Enterococcus caccae ATCC BAA-1240]OJG27994.1 hypothetical protein RU98_GL002203 [Enterococcus caccae]